MKRILVFGTLALGFSLADVAAAHAQRTGWSRGGVSVQTPGVGFSYGNPGWYGYGNPYGNWYGGRPYYYGPNVWGTRPYYGGWYNNYPGYYSVNPMDVYATGPQYPNQVMSFYQGDSQGQTQLRVHVPDANAQVTIDGQPTTQRGTDRVYAVPPLEPNRNYSYTLRATWMDQGREVTREKRIDFKAGDPLVVNFMDDLQRPNDREATGAVRTAEDRRAADGTPITDPPAQPQTLNGKIVRVEGNRVTMRLTDGGDERTLTFAGDGVVMRAGEKVTLQQVLPETLVSVTLRAGQPTMATRIDVQNTTGGETKP